MVKKLTEQFDYPGSPTTPEQWLSAIKPGITQFDHQYIDIVLANAAETADKVQRTPYGEVYEFSHVDNSEVWTVATVHPDLGVVSFTIGQTEIESVYTGTFPPSEVVTTRTDWNNRIRGHLKKIYQYLLGSPNTPDELKSKMQSQDERFASLFAEIH